MKKWSNCVFAVPLPTRYQSSVLSNQKELEAETSGFGGELCAPIGGSWSHRPS